MQTLWNRLYADYVMPCRLHHYAALLQQARDAGYRQTSVRNWLHVLRAGRCDGGARGCGGSTANNGSGKGGNGGSMASARVLIHRHDIDTDLATARRMFTLEQRHGVRASYYFRLSTLDYGFMRDIEAYGSEASYHYEELATYAKARHLKQPDDVRVHMAAIRASFEQNFRTIEARLGHKLTTVASHGDFANRRLGIVNCEVLADAALRARCGIEAECYDAELMDSFELYISDRPAPQYFHPLAPQAALGHYRRICLLTHPAQWHASWGVNHRKNLGRLVEAWRW